MDVDDAFVFDNVHYDTQNNVSAGGRPLASLWVHGQPACRPRSRKGMRSLMRGCLWR